MRIRLFYGWYIVAAGVILSVYYMTFFAYGWTAFVNPIIATFGWSMTQIAVASSMRGAEAGVFYPIWGKLVDRYSPTKLMILGVIITSIGIFVLGKTQNLGMYYAGFLIVGFGSSLIMLIPNVSIGKWFKNNLGIASGVLAVGVGIGGLAAPLVVKLIDYYGWQALLMGTSFGMIILGIPLSFVFRKRPPNYQYTESEKLVKSTTQPIPKRNYDFETNVITMLKMKAFWHISFLTFTQYAVTSVLMLYIIPFLTSKGIGLNRETASTVITVYSLVSVSGRIPFGIAADKYLSKYTNAISIGLISLGLCVFLFIGAGAPYWVIILFGIIYGIGMSGMMPLRIPLLAEYFGTRNFGTVFGLNSIFMTIGTVLSPLIAGVAFDKYGYDYKMVWIVAIALGIIATMLILTIPSSRKRLLL